jgi:hypothetical protein
MYQIRGVGAGVVDYVKRLQPHTRQDPLTSPLLALQFLWNQDKHRLIHFWGLELAAKGTNLRIEGGTSAYTYELATGVLHSGDDAITVIFDGPADGKLNGRLATKVAFENPANPGPGTDDRLWGLHDATSGVVGMLLAAIDRQGEKIP